MSAARYSSLRFKIRFTESKPRAMVLGEIVQDHVTEKGDDDDRVAGTMNNAVLAAARDRAKGVATETEITFPKGHERERGRDRAVTNVTIEKCVATAITMNATHHTTIHVATTEAEDLIETRSAMAETVG